MDKLIAAVVQAGTPMFDTRRTLEKIDAYCEEAASAGAKLVVFPEAFLGGYPKGLGFGAHVGSRSEEGREEFRRYYEAAIALAGDEIVRVSDVAARHRIELVLGVVEKAGGTLYCTALFFGADGSLQGKHRKLMPTGSERLIWGAGDGSTLPTIQTPFGNVGAAICWENYMPLFRAAMYAKGVSLWCAPTVDDRDRWQATMQHIAVEGRCFVLSACQYLLRSGCPEDYRAIQGNHPATVLIKGGSVIVSPAGTVLAGPLREGEGVLTAELDLKEIVRGKFDFDVVGHYARAEVFRLLVDENPKQAVTFGENFL
ncbi:MAG: nitrilase-related carbon-nitrogen hydrolase [Acidobacteriota bacterium]